jgi:parallel beta-helix repeat protein
MRSATIITFIVFVLNACQSFQNDSMNLVLIRDGNTYRIHDAVSQKKSGKFQTADQALQFAINGLNNGGTIEVMNGKYELHNTVYLRSGIHLKGSGRRTEFIVHATDTTGVGIFGKELKDVLVSDLSIIANDTIHSIAGICYDHCGDSKFERIYVEGFSKYGIWLRNNSFLCHINNCTAADNHGANIYTDSLFWSRAGEYMPNLITNCITYGGYNGIEARKSIVLNIVGCIVHQPRNYGYYIHHVSNSVLLSGCRTYQTQNHAVYVSKSHEINLTGNIFCWSREKGIVLDGVDWGVISGNNVIDAGSERYGGNPGIGDAIGIELINRTRSVQVTANNIFNWGGQGIMKYAVYEDESCEYNSFTSLNINYFEKAGVVSKGKHSIVKDIVLLDTPSWNGIKDGPDPLFKPELLKDFINE